MSVTMQMLFERMLSSEASDLHLGEGLPPHYRVHGRLLAVRTPPIGHDGMLELMKSICAPDRWQHFLARGDLDFAYALGEKARFRVNYMKKHTGVGAVFRIIPTKIHTLEELNLPPALGRFVEMRCGMVLVTGPTGSGKSTTLAAIIDGINSRESRTIITIEEPIEFVHVRKKSIIRQREVGFDVNSSSDALRNVSRQDAEVLLVGDMRDFETIQLAVTAAETGTLVLGTLHTNSAAKTVDRIIDVFPPGQQAQVRGQLSQGLKGVCAQRLLKAKDGKGMVPANEIMFANWAIANAIRDGDTAKIRSIIQSGKAEGMQLMDDAILQLLQQGKVSGHEAYLKADDNKRFLEFRGQEMNS